VHPRPDSMPETGVTVALMAPGQEAEWDAFLVRQEHGTVCHLSGWRRVLEEVMGHETHFLMARGPDGAVAGLLPLARVRSRIFGDFLVSLPFLNDGGPLGAPDACASLMSGAVELARQSGVDLLEVRSRHPVPGPVSDASRKVTVLLDLPSSAGELWEKTLRAKVRSQIRRPQKEGMTVRFGPDQLPSFYRVFARNMRDLGTPVLPWRFFEEILRTFPNEVRFGVVYHGTEAVAAGCGFLWQGEFEMTWASALRDFNAMAPNMLLYWGFMERAIEEGCGVFNFGRCTPGGGTHRFKLQWGGRDLPLPWARWAPGGTETTPSPRSRKYRAAVRAWQLLPLAAANRLGPLLARNIP
jgi:serine/alanine adding enzyme